LPVQHHVVDILVQAIEALWLVVQMEAANWVHRQQMAGNVAALMAAFEVTFLGMLWRATGDLSAPAAACLMLHGVGFASLHKFAFQKNQRE
jgi:type III secretory pathway component EscT